MTQLRRNVALGGAGLAAFLALGAGQALADTTAQVNAGTLQVGGDNAPAKILPPPAPAPPPAPPPPPVRPIRPRSAATSARTGRSTSASTARRSRRSTSRGAAATTS